MRKLTRSANGGPSWPDVDAGRRRNMQANRGKHTKPELAVRRMLHALGYRYRLHRRDLPGRPDVVFPSRRKIVEVRGCFWHGHGCFPLGQMPRSRTDYWGPKIVGNKERDARNLAALRSAGWDVLEIWECKIRAAPDNVRRDLVEFLGPPGLVRAEKSARNPRSSAPSPAG